jgi:lysozyme
MSDRNQEETVFNIIKYNPAMRTDQIKIKAMQEGVSCADRYLRWLQESGHVQSRKYDKDRTKTWSWTGKPYFIAKKNHPKTTVDQGGQHSFLKPALAVFVALALLSGSPALAGSFASGEAMTKHFEGYRSTPYLCPAGARSIGWGFNIDEPATRRLLPLGVLSGTATLKEEQAEHAFGVLYGNAKKVSKEFLGEEVFRRLTPLQQDIITDMSYNLGKARLLGFKRMRAAIIAGDYARAAEEMKNSKWYHQTGGRARHHVQQFAEGNN